MLKPDNKKATTTDSPDIISPMKLLNQKGEAIIFIMAFVFGMTGIVVEQDKQHKESAQRHYDEWHQKHQEKEEEKRKEYEESRKYRLR